MFQLQQVSKRFSDAPALEQVTLEIPARSVCAVVGTSGSGKSTLLRLLLGLTWPDQGQVLIEGRPLSRDNRLAVRRQIGYVIQEGGLFPHLTARGNLALLPQYLGWDRARIARRIDELCTLVQLPASLMQRYPGELSGGQRQRIAIMRALMTDPPALLLDEPLGALDPLVRFELQHGLQQLFATLGKTVVLVTHDVAEAAFLAPRLLVMHQGRLVQDGSLQALLQQPANDFVRAFVHAQRTLPIEAVSGR